MGLVCRHGEYKSRICIRHGYRGQFFSVYYVKTLIQLTVTPKMLNLAIFVLTDRQTKPIALPLAHVHGVSRAMPVREGQVD